MEFIDKSINQAAGNLLVNNFLTSRWNNLSNNYSQINYSTHPNHPFRLSLRDLLKQLLLKEQKNICCYCMRQLNNDDRTTFEHIVPKSVKTQVKLNEYTHYPIIGNNVCLQSVFDNATTQLNTPPFPLEIAYENLVASCNGRIIDGQLKDTTPKFCNNYRLSNLVEPLFYVSTI